MSVDLKTREKTINRILFVILFLNVFVAVIKIAAGHFFHYLSLTSSGFESLFDGSANVMALISIFFAYKPADKDHNYGHHKYETLGSLLIALLLFSSAVKIFLDLMSYMNDSSLRPQFGWIPLCTILISMIISLLVSIYERSKGEELGSPILVADASHTMGDFIISFGVLASIIVSYFGFIWFDLVVGIVVSMYLFYLAFGIVRKNLPDLLDASPVVAKNIIQILENDFEVMGIHRFRVRGNQNCIYVDCHLMLDDQLSLKEAHTTGHQIEDKIKEYLQKESENVDVVIHIEPYDKNHSD